LILPLRYINCSQSEHRREELRSFSQLSTQL